MQRWEMHRNCPWIVSTSQFYYINQEVEGVETRPLERRERTGWLKCVAQNLGSSLARHACTCLTADRSPITILSQSIWIHSCCIFVHPIWLVEPLIQNMTARPPVFQNQNPGNFPVLSCYSELKSAQDVLQYLSGKLVSSAADICCWHSGLVFDIHVVIYACLHYWCINFHKIFSIFRQSYQCNVW